MNYSKWDKFVAEQSDSDDEQAAPSVHTVGDGQAVRLGPQGYEISDQPKAAGKSAPISARVQELVPDVDRSKWMINGSRGDNYYWRQDRQEVVLTVLLGSQVKGRDIRITYEPSSKLFTIQDAASNGIILSGHLKHGIDTENMTVADPAQKSVLAFDPADWEVKELITGTIGSQVPSSSTQQTRFIELTMRKVSPLPGAIFWWSACFTHETEIDVTKIAGRSGMRLGASTAAGASTAGADLEQRLREDPYVQAQQMFAERMRNRAKVELDLDT